MLAAVLSHAVPVCSHLGFLHLTGQQQAASLGVECPSFAVNQFVGFPVKFDGTWYPRGHGYCINAHSYIYTLTKTQV